MNGNAYNNHGSAGPLKIGTLAMNVEQSPQEKAEEAGWRPPRRRYLAGLISCRWGHLVPWQWEHCVTCGRHFEREPLARVHWMETADYLTKGGERYLGQCDSGDLWVWKRSRWVLFSERNPRHWLVYGRSRRAGKVTMLEREQGRCE